MTSIVEKCYAHILAIPLVFTGHLQPGWENNCIWLIDGTAAIWDLEVPGVIYKVDFPASGSGSEIAMHPDGHPF
jgi:hypothetical protein